MLSLRYALMLFVCAVAASALYYRYYFRPRLYLLLLGEGTYLEHYIERLPHMRERPDERQAMVIFLLDKRRAFVRSLVASVVCGAVIYILLLAAGATS